FFTTPAAPHCPPLSLHDALPIYLTGGASARDNATMAASAAPLCAYWSACSTFSPYTSFALAASYTPAFRIAAIAARPYGACSGLAIATWVTDGSATAARPRPATSTADAA